MYQLLMKQNSTYSRKQFICAKSFTKENTCQRKKVLAMAKFVNQYKIVVIEEMGYTDWLLLGFFYQLE